MKCWMWFEWAEKRFRAVIIEINLGDCRFTCTFTYLTFTIRSYPEEITKHLVVHSDNVSIASAIAHWQRQESVLIISNVQNSVIIEQIKDFVTTSANCFYSKWTKKLPRIPTNEFHSYMLCISFFFHIDS